MLIGMGGMIYYIIRSKDVRSWNEIKNVWRWWLILVAGWVIINLGTYVFH